MCLGCECSTGAKVLLLICNLTSEVRLVYLFSRTSGPSAVARIVPRSLPP
jgi:hypothetical protein